MAQIVKRKNKNGSTSYLFRVSTGFDRNGKQVTTSRTFTPPPTLTGRKLEKEVRRRADEFEQEVHNGLALDADMKLDDLIDRWFSEYIDKKCKPKTGVEYRYLRPRISAALGHMRVNQIRPSHLMAFYSSLEEAGARRDSVYLATPALLKELPRGELHLFCQCGGKQYDDSRDHQNQGTQACLEQDQLTGENPSLRCYGQLYAEAWSQFS